MGEQSCEKQISDLKAQHKSDNVNRDFEQIRVTSSLQNRAAKQSNAYEAAKKLSEERENGYKEEIEKLKTETSHQYKLLQVVCKVRTTFCEECQSKLKAGMKKIRKPEL